MCCCAARYRPWPVRSFTNRRLKCAPQRWYRATVWSLLHRVEEGTYKKGCLYGHERYLYVNNVLQKYTFVSFPTAPGRKKQARPLLSSRTCQAWPGRAQRPAQT